MTNTAFLNHLYQVHVFNMIVCIILIHKYISSLTYRYSEVPTDIIAFQGECTGSELSLHHCSTTGEHMCIEAHTEHYVGIVCNKVSYHKEATEFLSCIDPALQGRWDQITACHIH